MPVSTRAYLHNKITTGYNWSQLAKTPNCTERTTHHSHSRHREITHCTAPVALASGYLEYSSNRCTKCFNVWNAWVIQTLEERCIILYNMTGTSAPSPPHMHQKSPLQPYLRREFVKSIHNEQWVKVATPGAHLRAHDSPQSSHISTVDTR